MNDLSITKLKGIGEKTGFLFNQLGIFDVEDLIEFYPIRFVPYEKMISIEEAEINCSAAICAKLASRPHTIRSGKLKITEAAIEDFTGRVTCIWYNSPYITSNIDSETEYVFAGKFIKKKNRIFLEHPVIYNKDAYSSLAGKLQPVYHATKGLSQKLIRKAVSSAFEKYVFDEDYLPLDIREKYNLTDYRTASIRMHFPENSKDVCDARRRLVFDEFFNFIYSINALKKGNGRQKSAFLINTDSIMQEFCSNLPFELTQDQQNAVDDIFNDFNSGFISNRLIQGDVGSGKTIVSLIALYAAYKSGHQGVIMVPTEVLANQHFRTCEKVFDSFRDKPNVLLLTGSMTTKEKDLARDRIKHGNADIIIGTHALIQDSVDLERAAVVVTDEQHRFGVRQRERLSTGKNRPHVIVMSATPIPRTLAVILYGDLDISVIVNKPNGRLPTKNAVIGIKDRGKAYRTILNEIRSGHQAYIICPMVEESDAVDAENVMEYAERIKSIFPDDIVIQFLHGRMKQDEKDNIMCSFIRGSINILVSTTVIEVGVDVPNATVIMIENAERFGLAALHQLRGRVGRGDAQSYCILVQTNDSEIARQRLEVIKNSNDGFYIASEDLRLRGPGEILGSAQSGAMRFHIGDVFSDSDVLQMARECCAYVESELFMPDEDELIRFRCHMDTYRDTRLNNLNI